MMLFIARYLFSIFFFTILVFISGYHAHRLNRRGFLFNLPIGFCILIIAETLFLNFLTIIKGVNLTGVAGLNLIYALATILFMNRKKELLPYLKVIVASFKYLAGNPFFLLAIPILIIVLFSSLVYPPTTWDAMTYHMAKVAHWIQNHSVDYYDTSIKRQILFAPGAEYLILLLQLLSAGDYFAQFIQTMAMFCIVASIPRIMRAVGCKGLAADLSIIYVISIPMFILQGSSTYNDLAAAITAIGVLTCMFKFLNFKETTYGTGDFLMLSVTLSAAYLVKPTALFIVMPFLLVSLFNILYFTLKRKTNTSTVLKWSLISILAFSIIAGPETIRRINYAGCNWTKLNQEQGIAGIYSADIKAGKRIENSLENMSFHLIPGITDFLNVHHHDNDTETAEEDSTGNGIHFILILLSILIYFIRFKKLSFLYRIFAPCLLLSWLIFHWYVPWMPWNSRLHLPFFIISTLLVGVWFPVKSEPLLILQWKKLLNRLYIFPLLFIILLSISYAHGYKVAITNDRRPFKLSALRHIDRGNYYYHTEKLRPILDSLFMYAHQLKIDKIGLYIGEDDYDYPVTWQAYNQGIRTKHLLNLGGDTAYTRLIYSKKETDSLNMFWTCISSKVYLRNDLKDNLKRPFQ